MNLGGGGVLCLLLVETVKPPKPVLAGWFKGLLRATMIRAKTELGSICTVVKIWTKEIAENKMRVHLSQSTIRFGDSVEGSGRGGGPQA